MVGDNTEEPHCKKSSSFFIEKVVLQVNFISDKAFPNFPCLPELAPYLISVNVH